MVGAGDRWAPCAWPEVSVAALRRVVPRVGRGSQNTCRGAARRRDAAWRSRGTARCGTGSVADPRPGELPARRSSRASRRCTPQPRRWRRGEPMLAAGGRSRALQTGDPRTRSSARCGRRWWSAGAEAMRAVAVAPSRRGPPRPGSQACRGLACVGGRWRPRQHRETSLSRPCPGRAAARGGAAMTRGVLATANCARARRRICAAAAAALEVLDLRARATSPRRMTARARGWSGSRAREDRIGACPWREVEHDRRSSRCSTGSPTRERTWRHPTHADGQAGAVVALRCHPPR